MRRCLTAVLCALATMLALHAQERGATPVKPEDQIALQFAAWIDHIWELPPKEGLANLRFLFKKDGRLFEGKLSAETEFVFTAVGGENVQLNQALNPTPGGRWIYEDLRPGEYAILLQGRGRFAGWKWSRRIRVAAGETPLIEVRLDR